MRIIYVTAQFPFGRGEMFIGPEIAELQVQGHHVLVVPRSKGGEVQERYVHELGPSTVLESMISVRVLRAAVQMMLHRPRRALRVLGGLVQSPTLRMAASNLAVFPKGLWLAEMALRWQADHLHAHWAATTATMTMVASEVSGIPWSFTGHRWDIVQGNLLVRKARSATFVRFISKNGYIRALRAGVPEQRARLLHMGVRLPAAGSPEGNVPPRAFRMLCPAALLPVKGHAYLLQALTQIKGNVELWLAGEGPSRRNLKTQVKALDLEKRVAFLGQIPHASILRFYEERQVDAVVLPSVDLGNGLHEGIPVALMEAMAHGVPVISTATGGIPELLEGGAGMLVPPGDPAALASAIERLRGMPDLRTRLGRNGRQRVEEAFAVGQIASRLAHWFSECGTR